MMKKILLYLILHLTYQVCMYAAHPYQPFVEEGKVWYCEGYDLTTDHMFSITGDTIIQNVPYKKVYHKYPVAYNDDNFHYYAAVRESEKKVSIIYADEEKELLLYDFSLGIINNSTQIAENEYYQTYITWNIMTVSEDYFMEGFDGDLHSEPDYYFTERRLVGFRSSVDENHFNDVAFYSSHIIEGIGMQLHPFRPYSQAIKVSNNENYEILQVVKDGKLLMKGGDFAGWPADFLQGDVNGDELVDVEDVNAAISFILGESKSEWDDVSADINHDYKIDVADVNAIINIILSN